MICTLRRVSLLKRANPKAPRPRKGRPALFECDCGGKIEKIWAKSLRHAKEQVRAKYPNAEV